MDRVSGALIVIAALFGLWILNTGRWTPIKNAVLGIAPDLKSTPGAVAGAGLVSSNAKGACHSIFSLSCITQLGKDYADYSTGNASAAQGDFSNTFGS